MSVHEKRKVQFRNGLSHTSHKPSPIDIIQPQRNGYSIFFSNTPETNTTIHELITATAALSWLLARIS